MNLRKVFRITTWVLSLVAFVGGITYAIIWSTIGYKGYWYTDSPVLFILAFASFATIWLIYWIFYGIRHRIVKWFDKEKILYVIKWAVIIFLASVLFHLADYVVHKTTKFFEEGPKPKRKLEFKFGK